MHPSFLFLTKQNYCDRIVKNRQEETRLIYLDNAATTPICDAAKKAIIEHLDDFGNPSSSHTLGHNAKMLIEDARERIAKCINAEPNEIYFTSGGSEANSLALHFRVTLASNIEHHSIVPQEFYTPIHKSGIINLDNLQETIMKQELKSQNEEEGIPPYDMISCMAINNEIGTIQPIDSIAKIAHNNGLLFHTDAVQAIGHIPIDVKSIGCDMLSASGHKFGAPKGVGFLYVKNGNWMIPLIDGGKQERKVRGGTENVLGIIAMAAALEDSIKFMDLRNNQITILKEFLLRTLLDINGVYLNGSKDNRICSNINVRINGVKGEDVVSMADEYGICISSGSACNEGNAEPSHVLKAIGLTDEEALSSIRITIGHQNTVDEINYVCEILPKIIERLRQIA